MAQQLYSIELDPETNECHIFLSNNNTKTQKCELQTQSICKKMQFNQNAQNYGLCIDENEARLTAAKIGRKMCGICVSDLYKTL